MGRFVVLVSCVCVLTSSAVPADDAVPDIGPIRLTGSSESELILENCHERPATVLVFLSSRCRATERMVTAINRLYNRYRLREVLYVGVCTSPLELEEELQTFAHRRGLIFSIYRDPDGACRERFGVRATPEVCVLNREGRLVWRGGVDRPEGLEALEAVVRQMLAGQPVDVDLVPPQGTRIGHPDELIIRSDPYGSPSFSSELVFERIPGVPAHHCSTIVEAPNGDLLCLWYGGSFESADDQKLLLSRRTAGRRHWSEPRVLLENPRTPPGNAVLFVDGHDRVQIVWGRMESSRPIRRGGGWGRCRLFARTSPDNGHSWSDDRMLMSDDELVRKDAFFCVPRNPPLTLSDGVMVLPLEGPGGGVFLRSTDGGDTWHRGGTASSGSQPAVIQRNDGSLFTLMRSSPRSTTATSADGGLTWSETRPTELKNPGSGISMVRLANGHLVFVFNDSTEDRTPLSIVRSVDEGRTWETPMQLESNPGEYSYPCVIQSSDGQIHVTYTFRRYSVKHVELNEDWLTQLERPN